jgi:hypothetical protein
MGDSDLQLQEVNSVTWTDDDGSQYKRVIRDGEIKDIPVGSN